MASQKLEDNPQWATSPRFRVSGRSTFGNFKMKFELKSCKREKNVSFYCQNQRIESLGEHYTKEVCILSRNLVDGVPGPSIKRSGEKPLLPTAEDPRPVRYEQSPGSRSLNRRPHLVDERHPDTEHREFLFFPPFLGSPAGIASQQRPLKCS